jgi:hypothetical protein
VRASESECPFCLTALEFGDTSAPRAPAARLGRAATFAFGAAVATTMQVAGCSGGTTPGDVDSGSGTDSGGGSEIDAHMPQVDAGSDAGMMALYGGPPDDAGQDSGTGVVPAYGAPAIDAGPQGDDGGGIAPLYGATPGA